VRTLGSDQKVGGSDETRVPTDQAYVKECRRRYGAEWEESYHRLVQATAEKEPILNLYEIGKDKRNRPTELVFVERCLSLLKPGGRMGIVLPDGNLNSPSLSWLRRWAEGRAKLLAVVSLPEETFRSSKASVKASLVFMRRFTEEESAAWEVAWAKAHSELDANFDKQRNALHSEYAHRIVSGKSDKAAKLLNLLKLLGVSRTLPAWEHGEPPAYPRGIGPTVQGKPAWAEKVSEKNRKAAAKLKNEAFTTIAATQKASDALLSELRAKYRAVDEAQNVALWARVRELCNYPVFIAAPKTIGITSTGETGENVPNDLPALLTAYRSFEAWIEKGAKPEDVPNFPMPSAA
jgi:type I restriction enzyme M protein